ncbi:RHS repeat-associated core domain-containing protein [Flavobacterium sp. LHD-85]|uniref:RHS repeat domain-containing protein n=1 Tax=Flavobacterium sp. LHD-85 TaxID=3071410 RepID=UPI0027DFFF0E|nr:RHS repeat-associated core domain-containing protein [Flavobacterium sp. LHD-85]MDQ6528089.1 RHS repeat-associated core domain-containing protein [Flavobacterium sp. LHD-85]
MIYVNTEEIRVNGQVAEKAQEKKLLWDEENRLRAIDINGYVSNYTYDAGGERVTKLSGGGQGIFVNSVFSGGKTSTSDFTLYVNPYLVAQNGGRCTKHIYIGSQRIVSKIGDFDSYGADPRRVEKAGESFSGVKVNYDTKYKKALEVVKASYDTFEVPYYGTDNNDYVNGLGFCCNPSGDTGSGSSSSTTGKLMAGKNDNAELQQFYYHPDHLGSSSYISNLDGEVVQHVEYVPFEEVFLEEKNAKWNTPYLFTSKELDRETGMYYFGARYYDSKGSFWISVDPLAVYNPVMEEEFYYDGQHNGGSYNDKNLNTYGYCYQNPVLYVDPNGKQSMAGALRGIPEGQADNVTRGWNQGLKNGGYGVDFVPVIGDIKGIGEGIYGVDMQGNELSIFDRSLSVLLLSELRNTKNGIKAIEEFSKIRKITKIVWGENKYGGTIEKAIDHIKKGHFFDARKGQVSSRFSQSLSNIKDVKALVQEAVVKGKHAGGKGNYEVLHTFDKVIGTDSAGKATKTLKVYLDESGKVLNAYPVGK